MKHVCSICGDKVTFIMNHIEFCHGWVVEAEMKKVWENNRPVPNPQWPVKPDLRAFIRREYDKRIKELPDTVVFTEASKEQQWAWEEIHRRYGKRIKDKARYIANIIRSKYHVPMVEANDIEQDLWIFVIKGIRVWNPSKAKDEGLPSAYMTRILNTSTPKIIRHYCKISPEAHLEFDHCPDYNNGDNSQNGDNISRRSIENVPDPRPSPIDDEIIQIEEEVFRYFQNKNGIWGEKKHE